MTSEIELALEALLFGSTWYFGILTFMILAICIMIAWKYAGALIVPMVLALEVQYYNRLEANPDFAWAMITLLCLIIGIALYTVNAIKEK